MKIYHLWNQDWYVDESGRVDPPNLAGTFTSLEKLNGFVQLFWFEFIVDLRGKIFTETQTKFEGSGKRYGIVYFEEAELDPENSDY